jgi:hypothetical protein
MNISIDKMCFILKEKLMDTKTEYTDCTILYTVTFEQLRSLYVDGLTNKYLDNTNLK